MPFAIGDKVRVAASRGGFAGFVFEILGGPGGKNLYRIINEAFDDPEKGGAIVAEADIVAGPLVKKVFAIGDAVSLAGRGGTITDIQGPAYTVDIPSDGTKDWDNSRVHIVEQHQLDLEN